MYDNKQKKYLANPKETDNVLLLLLPLVPSDAPVRLAATTSRKEAKCN